MKGTSGWQYLSDERSPGPAELHGWTRAAWYTWDADGEHCSLHLARYRWEGHERVAQYKYRRKWLPLPWYHVTPTYRRLTKAQALRRGIPPLLDGVHVRCPNRDCCARCSLTGQLAWHLKRTDEPLPLCPL